jgi:hypothetical protein
MLFIESIEESQNIIRSVEFHPLFQFNHLVAVPLQLFDNRLAIRRAGLLAIKVIKALR